MTSVSTIRVAVLEEHDIFRRGIVACLSDDPSIDIVFEAQAGPIVSGPDIAVVSHVVALGERLTCPLVVCSTDRSARAARYEPNIVLGVLPRSELTGEQLIATVRAAATGLRVQPRDAAPPQHSLDDRSLEVLRMLSRGADTQQISHALSYSERTVKTLISDLQRSLGARNRTHAVAEGIRNGFI
jgi:DNA-binding NarL/FixJ family response regulator